MVRLTIDLPEDVAQALRETAGDASLEHVVADLAANRVAELRRDEPPPEVLQEIRRRQETPLSECLPVDQAHDQLVRRLREKDAAEQAARQGAQTREAV